MRNVTAGMAEQFGSDGDDDDNDLRKVAETEKIIRYELRILFFGSIFCALGSSTKLYRLFKYICTSAKRQE